MAEISNITLAVLVFSALVVVIAGAALNFMSLSNSGTGFLTSDIGNVSLSVSSSLAIALNSSHNVINFGACTPRAASSYWCSSNDSAICDGTLANNCTGDTGATQYLEIDNVGNVNASINITANDCDASTLIGGTAPAFSYMTVNCTGTAVSSWTSFVAGAQQNQICSSLTYSPQGHLALFANITIPYNAIGPSGTCATNGNKTRVTFTGTLAP